MGLLQPYALFPIRKSFSGCGKHFAFCSQHLSVKYYWHVVSLYVIGFS
jgi:hypothetical protein